MLTDKAMESRVRRKAKRNGYYLRKSRRWSFHPDDEGEFMLLDADTDFPVIGFRYDASLADADAWLST